MISFLVLEIITFTSHPFSDFALPANILQLSSIANFHQSRPLKIALQQLGLRIAEANLSGDGVMEGMVNTEQQNA